MIAKEMKVISWHLTTEVYVSPPVEMEYIEHTSYNIFYPFQNNHQIHWHLQSVKLLGTFTYKIKK